MNNYDRAITEISQCHPLGHPLSKEQIEVLDAARAADIAALTHKELADAVRQMAKHNWSMNLHFANRVADILEKASTEADSLELKKQCERQENKAED